jgi:hypothetical protein
MSRYNEPVYETFSVSVFTTDLSPPVKRPAEYSVPAVLSTVETAPVPNTRKHPFTVPEPVIAKARAAERAFDPEDAALHAHVFRGAVYVGAFAFPASSQPACEDIVSAAAIAE